MIFFVLIGLMISVLFPSIGLLYMIPIAGKYTLRNRNENNFLFFLGWFLSAIGLILINWISVPSFLNIFFGIGVNLILILIILRRYQNVELAVTISAIINTLTATVKYLFYHKEFISGLELSVKQSIALLSTKYPVGTKEYDVFKEIIDLSKDIYINYNYSLSVLVVIICTWIGIAVYNREESDHYKWFHYRTMNYFVYVLTIGLILTLIKPYKLIGLNILIACSGFFLIQGLSVFWFLFKTWLIQSKLLVVIAVLSLLLNPYLLVFTALFGLIDMWYDFRKLNLQEETHENNIN